MTFTELVVDGLWSVPTSQINLKIQSSKPDPVVLHLGGNDLDVTQVNEQYCEELVIKLVLLSDTFISRHRLQSVTICEFVPRQKTRHITVEKYNYFKRITNKFIKNELVFKSKINFWKIKWVKEWFGDGLHLNDEIWDATEAKGEHWLIQLSNNLCLYLWFYLITCYGIYIIICIISYLLFVYENQ